MFALTLIGEKRIEPSTAVPSPLNIFFGLFSADPEIIFHAFLPRGAGESIYAEFFSRPRAKRISEPREK
jgi:hypothetical protein